MERLNDCPSPPPSYYDSPDDDPEGERAEWCRDCDCCPCVCDQIYQDAVDRQLDGYE